jgi:3D (Asp-Asp-Asp) domain-containing protein
MRSLAALIFCVALAAEDWEPVEAVATSYCPCKICCGSRAVGLTADGTDVHDEPYGVAVDPKQIPYGTSIFIPAGEGYLDKSRSEDRVFLADDTGGIIRRRTRATGVIHIDLRFKHHNTAQKFGVKTMTIWIYR